MMVLADIVFLRPLWVLALPVILALMLLNLRRSARPGDWQTHIQPQLLSALTALGRVETGRNHLTAALPFVVAGAVALALTGPALEKRSAQTFRNLDGVVFVMDVSGSMTRDASWPGAVNMVRAGLSVLGSKPAALVVFAGDSYLAAPLTTDHLQLGQTVSVLDEATVPDRGNRPALALAQAAALLEEAQVLAGDVVLITDGGGLGPDAFLAAEKIARLGARLSVIAVPTEMLEQPATGQATFETLTQLGGGTLYETGDVARFMQDMKSADVERLERQDLQLLLLADYGRYLLLFAMLPVLMLFRRERV